MISIGQEWNSSRVKRNRVLIEGGVCISSMALARRANANSRKALGKIETFNYALIEKLATIIDGAPQEVGQARIKMSEAISKKASDFIEKSNVEGVDLDEAKRKFKAKVSELIKDGSGVNLARIAHDQGLEVKKGRGFGEYSKKVEVFTEGLRKFGKVNVAEVFGEILLDVFPRTSRYSFEDYRGFERTHRNNERASLGALFFSGLFGFDLVHQYIDENNAGLEAYFIK